MDQRWERIIQEYITHLTREECSAVAEVTCEATFRDWFESNCRRHQEAGEGLLYNHLQTGFRNWESLEIVLGQFAERNATKSPIYLFWGAFAGILEVLELLPVLNYMLSGGAVLLCDTRA